MQYLLAHDLGTSGDKASLFTVDGTLVKSVVAGYPCSYGIGNCVEQHPDLWYAAVCRTTQSLASLVDPAQIVGVSFSGHMMGAVLLDDSGALLRPAIIWADQRAVSERALLSQRVGDWRLYEITGNRNNPTNSICKIMWSMANDGLKDRLAKALNCKDYLIYRLTGCLGTDYSDASGTGVFDLNTFTWSQEILEAAGVPMSVMPELHASTDLAGHIMAQASQDTGLLEGTPVFCGCGDGIAASVGTGISKVGQAYMCLGTSAWLSYLDDAPLLDPQQRTFNLAGITKGLYYPIGAMQAAGASYNWMRGQLCLQEAAEAKAKNSSIYDEINRQIAQIPPGANGVLFLPYLMGERSPWWDVHAKGAFLGLGPESTHSEMLRAVMEGVCLNLGLIMEVFREKHDFSALRIIGGAAKEPLWRQMLADVLRVRVEKLSLLEEGCSLGAAIVAGIGAGVFCDVTAIDKFLHIDSVSEPDAAQVEQYAQVLPHFQDAYERLKGFYG